LRPPRIRLPVIHDEFFTPEQPRDAKRQCLRLRPIGLALRGLPVDFSDIHDARETERSPRDRNRCRPHHVIHDLVIVQEPCGIRLSYFPIIHTDDDFFIAHEVDGGLGWFEYGGVDGWNSVSGQNTNYRISVNDLLNILNERKKENRKHHFPFNNTLPSLDNVIEITHEVGGNAKVPVKAAARP
jgi:hypothetical protein